MRNSLLVTRSSVSSSKSPCQIAHTRQYRSWSVSLKYPRFSLSMRDAYTMSFLYSEWVWIFDDAGWDWVCKYSELNSVRIAFCQSFEYSLPLATGTVSRSKISWYKAHTTQLRSSSAWLTYLRSTVLECRPGNDKEYQQKHIIQANRTYNPVQMMTGSPCISTLQSWVYLCS